MVAKQISAVIVVSCLGLILCGCRPSIVGSNAGVYSRGKLYAVTNEDVTRVYKATLKALEELEIEVTEHAKDVFYARVIAQGADGKRIIVQIKPRDVGGTDLSIKVGLLGDQGRSSIIYGRIQQNLGIGD